MSNQSFFDKLLQNAGAVLTLIFGFMAAIGIGVEFIGGAVGHGLDANALGLLNTLIASTMGVTVGAGATVAARAIVTQREVRDSIPTLKQVATVLQTLLNSHAAKESADPVFPRGRIDTYTRK